MEIVPITSAEFEGIRPPNARVYGFVTELKVGAAVRLRGHKHVPPRGRKIECGVYSRVRKMADRHGIHLRMVHDGADLLVMRVK